MRTSGEGSTKSDKGVENNCGRPLYFILIQTLIAQQPTVIRQQINLGNLQGRLTDNPRSPRKTLQARGLQRTLTTMPSPEPAIG